MDDSVKTKNGSFRSRFFMCPMDGLAYLYRRIRRRQINFVTMHIVMNLEAITGRKITDKLPH
jgi:hypothetical protein